MRLMADRMLEGLARWLRLAGYDCAMPPEIFITPQAVLESARAAGRVLLTTAGGLEPLARPGELCRLSDAPLEDWFREVATRYPIDFEILAFSRCSRDNTPLEPVTFEDVAAQLPLRVAQAKLHPIRRCPQCHRLYWPGSHLERIRHRLAAWTGRAI